MHELNIKENFAKEVESMLLQFDSRIDDFSQEIAVENNPANNEEASDMNALKLHRYKLKELLIALEVIDDETWRRNRDTYKKAYEEAEQTLTLTP